MNSTISPLGTPNVTLTGQGLRRGARAVFPLLPGMVIFGLLCGVVARQAGLTFVENALMNMFVLAGTAQLASLEQWSYPLPLLSIVVTTLFINLRFLLHGAAAQPWLRSVNPRIVYAMLSVVNDQSWAIAMTAYRRGERDAGYFFGANLCVVPVWVISACCGYLIGSALGDPARIGVDFSVTIIFAASLVSAWRGRSDAIPWLAAGGAAMLTWWLVPGTWYILFGGLTGFAVGVLKTPTSPVAIPSAEESR